MAHTYTETPDGLGVMRDDGAFVPIDAKNRDSLALEVFLDDGGEILPPDVDLTEARAAAVAAVDGAAGIERGKHISDRPGEQLVLGMRFREAELADVDGSPTAGEYPLLNAEVPHTAATIALVADAVLAERAALATALAAIEAVRFDAHADIAAAANVDAVAAVVEAIAWP